MRAAASSLAPRVITSGAVRGGVRAAHALRRRMSGARPMIHYFHQADDPYSHLAAQALSRLSSLYDVEIAPHLVSPPDAGAAPEPERLAAYARRDAALLAAAHGLSFPVNAQAPSADLVAKVSGRLAYVSEPSAFAREAVALGERMWRGEAIDAPPLASREAFAAGDALRARLGHYLGATFHFEGEWYWGLDRLPYLEERLKFAARPGAAIPAFRFPRESEARGAAGGVTLDFFLSFRSPYTYLAAARIRDLAARYGAELRLRFVLPMVMRGLPVPPAKRLYIVRDAKREAERFNLPFGKICDPVGAGAQRGLAVLHHAIRAEAGPEFAESFLKAVFAEGVDAATDEGLDAVAKRAGLSPSFVRIALADESWRAVAEANREEMFALGVWGVPSFRVGARAAHWGQDRLWAVEADLAAEARAHSRLLGERTP